MAKFKIYDEDDNFIGEYVGEFVEDAKDTVTESFEDSAGAGLFAIVILLVIKFPWMILVILGWLLLKAIWIVVKAVAWLLWEVLKVVLRSLWWLLGLFCLSIWWLIRLPFTWLFHKELPDWWFPVW